MFRKIAIVVTASSLVGLAIAASPQANSGATGGSHFTAAQSGGPNRAATGQPSTRDATHRVSHAHGGTRTHDFADTHKIKNHAIVRANETLDSNGLRDVRQRSSGTAGSGKCTSECNAPIDASRKSLREACARLAVVQ